MSRVRGRAGWASAALDAPISTKGWAAISLGQVMMGLLAGSYVWLRFNNQRRERELEALVAERTRSLHAADASLQRRHQIAEGMRDVLAALNSNQPLDQILALLARQCHDLLSAQVVGIGRVDAAGLVTLQAYSDASVDMDEQTRHPLVWDGVAEAIAAGQVAVVTPAPSASLEPGRPLLSLEQQPAVLVAPIMADAAHYRGAVLLGYADPAAITPEEIELAMPFAAQAALAVENARLKTTASEIATMEERSRVARELHDSVTQYLYAITLNADAVRLALEAGKVEKSQEQLRQLKSIAQAAMSEVRMLIYELRPASVEELGLEGALQQRLQAVEARSGLSVDFESRLEEDIPPGLQDVLYRVILEGLNNVLKHAQANRVSLHIVAQDHRCRVTLHDDGVGFDVATARRYGGYGLLTIDERLQAVRGSLAIDSQPGVGSTLEIEAPL